MNQQKSIVKTLQACLTSLTIVLCFSAQAQQNGAIEISRHSIDNGSAESSAGDFQIRGSIGQTDTQLLTGDQFTVQGGFWVPAQTDALFEDQFEGQSI